MPFCAWSRFSASSKTTDCGPSITVVGDLLAAMGGQAMHEDRVLLRRAHQLVVDLITLQQVLAPPLILVAHRDPAIGHHAIGAFDRLERIAGEGDARAVLVAPRGRDPP